MKVFAEMYFIQIKFTFLQILHLAITTSVSVQ